MGRNHHCTEDEKKIVQAMKKEGKSLREIAKSIGRSLHFVQNALSNKQNGENRGRPKKTTPETDMQIMLMVKKDPFKSSKTISAEIDNKISPQTVRRRLLQANLPGRIARQVALIHKQNMKMRLEYAKEHLLWSRCEDENNWQNMLWSDETEINLFTNDCQRNVKRPKEKEFFIKFTKKTIKQEKDKIIE